MFVLNLQTLRMRHCIFQVIFAPREPGLFVARLVVCSESSLALPSVAVIRAAAELPDIEVSSTVNTQPVTPQQKCTEKRNAGTLAVS